MKNIKKFAAAAFAVIMAMLTSVTVFAAGLSVNGASAQVGETVTYTLNLADVPTPVAGIQLSVYYDSEFLEVDTSSVSYDGFPGALVNTDIPGEIVMNASNGVDGYDFKTKSEVISVSFKVLKEGSSNITYYIDELFDIYEYGPGDYLKTYTLTSDISVNGGSSVTDKPPMLNPDRNDSENNGDFVNSDNGIGEVSPEDATIPPTDNNGSSEGSSDPSEDPSGNSGDTDSSNGSESQDASSTDNSGSTSAQDSSENADASPTPWIIAGAAVVVIAAAVIAIAVVNKKKAAKTSAEATATSDNSDKKD